MYDIPDAKIIILAQNRYQITSEQEQGSSGTVFSLPNVRIGHSGYESHHFQAAPPYNSDGDDLLHLSGPTT